MPAIPQSEVLAKFFEEVGEKCGEILAKFFADFRPSISKENGRKKIHEKSSTFSTVHQIKFFHCCNSGGLGAQDTRLKNEIRQKSKALSASRTRSERDRNEIRICMICGHEGTRQASIPVCARIFLVEAAGVLKHLKTIYMP